GRISSTGPPHRCTWPEPAVTNSVWPSGCVCHAVRAPGSNVTLEPPARAGGTASNNGSIRTVPVNHSAGPFVDGWDPARLISMSSSRLLAHALTDGRAIAATVAQRANLLVQP